MCKTTRQCECPENMKGKDTDDCTLKDIRECHPEFYKKIKRLWKEEFEGTG